MAKQDYEKIRKWKSENVTRLYLEVRNNSGLIDRMQAAVDAGKAKSRQAYILKAIASELDRDGIAPDAEQKKG